MEMTQRSIIGTIEEFFHPTWANGIERRAEPREPFHRPVTVTFADGRERAAFTRNISRNGVGLVHREPMPTGLAQIDIRLRTAGNVQVTAEILWCGRHEGYYVSGARFLEEFVR